MSKILTPSEWWDNLSEADSMTILQRADRKGTSFAEEKTKAYAKYHEQQRFKYRPMSKILTPSEWWTVLPDDERFLIMSRAETYETSMAEEKTLAYAKYYHQSQVESMTDDVIDVKYKINSKVNRKAAQYNREGAKWLREELLKKNQNFER